MSACRISEQIKLLTCLIAQGCNISLNDMTIISRQAQHRSELRRRVLIGLNKGESLNSLARKIFFGSLGEIRERTSR
jgi:TnpA family transposase